MLFRGLWKQGVWIRLVAEHYDEELEARLFLRLQLLAESIESVRQCVAHPALFVLPQSADLARSRRDAVTFIELVAGELCGDDGTSAAQEIDTLLATFTPHDESGRAGGRAVVELNHDQLRVRRCCSHALPLMSRPFPSFYLVSLPTAEQGP